MTSKIVINAKWLEQNNGVFNLMVKNSPQTPAPDLHTVLAHTVVAPAITKKTHLVLVRKEKTADSDIDQLVLEERPITWQDNLSAEHHTVIAHTVGGPTATVAGLVAAAAVGGGGGGGGASTALVLPPLVSPAPQITVDAPTVTGISIGTNAPASAAAESPSAMPAAMIEPVASDTITPVLAQPASVDMSVFGSFRPNAAEYYRTPQTELYVADINGDGVDELFWTNVAFDYEAQSWVNSYVTIFGFNTGNFTDETALWFAPGENEYTGGFKVNFGDFDGDGSTDVFLTAFTDTPNYKGDNVMLLNQGSAEPFKRFDIANLKSSDSHDTMVGDFNNDGVDDVWYTGTEIVLGSADRDFQVLSTAEGHHMGSAIGAGVSWADYMVDGTLSVVITDGPGDSAEQDTVLMRPILQDGGILLEKLADLPGDRFFLPKWDAVRASTDMSPHAVRNLAVDFDKDGRTDVVVFSTMPKNGNVHGYTEVQFLRNLGSSQFVDVTEDILVGFDHDKTVSYNPQLIDVNNDGRLDVFMPALDFTGQASNSVLFSMPDGRFKESALDFFADWHRSLPGDGNRQGMAFVNGPEGQQFLVTGVERTDQSDRAWIDVHAQTIDQEFEHLYAETVATLEPMVMPVNTGVWTVA